MWREYLNKKLFKFGYIMVESRIFFKTWNKNKGLPFSIFVQ